MSQELLAWDAHRSRWQRLDNEVPIPPRRAQVPATMPLTVSVRLEWERDGVEQLDTVARAWTTRAVLVELHDPRRQTIGVWLPVADVKRR